MKKRKTAEDSTSSEIDVETQRGRGNFNSALSKGGFFEQVGNKLEGKGYEFHTLVAVYSKDDIQVKYVLENKEATESVQKEVKSIFYESVENYNLDSNS